MYLHEKEVMKMCSWKPQKQSVSFNMKTYMYVCYIIILKNELYAYQVRYEKNFQSHALMSFVN